MELVTLVVLASCLGTTYVTAQSYGYQPQSYGYQPQSYGYQPQSDGYGSSYQPQPSYGYSQPSYDYQPQSYSYQPPSYQPQSYSYQPPSYQPQSYSYQPPSYQQPSYSYQPPSYEKEKVYVPVYVKPKKKKKQKIITVNKGFYVAGGTQAFGKFKSLKKCMKACGSTSTCFGGDFDPWLKRCYFHGNTTACDSMRAHKKLVHFKKVPCVVPFAPRGIVVLGAGITRGLAVNKAKSLSDCIKSCTSAIPVEITFDNLGLQVCYAITYDFATHKCFLHTNNANNQICPDADTTPVAPRDLYANAGSVTIAFCPIA